MTDPTLTPEVFGDDHATTDSLAAAKAADEHAESTTKYAIVGVRLSDAAMNYAAANWCDSDGTRGLLLEWARKSLDDAVAGLGLKLVPK